MLPLVPNLISEELNLIVALLIGIAFGFILEQAGFSSSKKLAGLFYGYDFTVLRVFFTAGVTAMMGVIILGFLGWLDTDFIYINPTYLSAAILGGAIMGLGFIIGGYCPGTSICGLAIGKIDAALFVAGGLIGVFVYAELYPYFEKITNAEFLGPVRIFDSLGVSMGVFGMALTIVAVGAFIITTRIERKVNPEAPSRLFSPRHHIAAGVAAVVFGVLLLFLPDYKERIYSASADPETVRTTAVKEMTADELAFRILDRDPHLTIIDLRNKNEFDTMALPGSVHMNIGDVLQKEFSTLLGIRKKKKVFVSNNETDARIAAIIAVHMGYENIMILCNGIDGLKSSVLDLTGDPSDRRCRFLSPSAAPAGSEQLPMAIRQRKDTERFRAKASIALREMIATAKRSAVHTPALVKKIAGGC